MLHMRTFEEWMAYRGIDITTLGEEELKAWRRDYDASCQVQSQRKIWTPQVRANPKDLLYAVAVRDGPDLWLALWVKRSTKPEYFVMLPRNDRPDWDPHASYHSDGCLHQKTHNRKIDVSQRQIPGPGFHGTENILTTRLDLEDARAVKALCDPGLFTGILEIPGEVLSQGHHIVAVDLTDTNGTALAHPCSQIVIQRRFSKPFPEVLLTVWRQKSLSLNRGC
jgi:hypothetical protein